MLAILFIFYKLKIIYLQNGKFVIKCKYIKNTANNRKETV